MGILEDTTLEKGRLLLNLDTDTVMDTDMEVTPVTMVVVLHTLDVPFGVWVNDQLTLNPSLNLKPNLDIMDMDMDMEVMADMAVTVEVTVMVMDTVTMVRSFQKNLVYSCYLKETK